MSWFGASSLHIGIERTSKGFRCAVLRKKWQGWQILRLEEIPASEAVKLLDIVTPDSTIASSLLSREELIRSIELPLKRKKDVFQALPFQIEPHLPYPLEKCLFHPLSMTRQGEGTSITLCSIKKESLQTHLEQWHRMGISPDYVTSPSYALAKLSLLFPLPQEPFIFLHFSDEEGTCALVEQGRSCSLVL